MTTFDEYEIATRVTSSFHERDMPTEVFFALGLAGEAGEVADKIKKFYRDHEGVKSPAFREAILLELGDVLWYLTAMADYLQIPLGEIATRNIEKSHGRLARKTLHGEGDHR